MTIHTQKKHYLTLPIILSLGLILSTQSNAATPTEEMSNTVETLCPQLAGVNNGDPSFLTSAEKDVLARCGELKRTSGQSFTGLSSDQHDGLNNMTSDESSVMGSSSVELSGAQSIAILGRLTVLRTNSASSVASYPPSSGKPEIKKTSLAKNSSGSEFNIGLPETITESLSHNVDGYTGNFSQMSDFGKWGFFLTGSYGFGDKDATSKEPAFDFDSWALVSGVDYRLSDQMVFGFALGYAMTNSSIDDNGGDVDLDGLGGSLYGSYYRGDFYLDMIAGYSYGDYATERNLQYSVAAKAGGTTAVNQSFTGDTNSNDINLSLGTGYNAQLSGLSLTPFAQFNYLHSEIDGYTESLQGNNSNPGFGLALSIDEQEVTSLNTSLGLLITHSLNTSAGVLVPYLRGDWVHEFDNDARDITASFATVRSAFDEINVITIPTDDPDRDFFNLGGGLSTVLRGGLQCFLDYSTILGYDDLSLHRFTAGIRFEF